MAEVEEPIEAIEADEPNMKRPGCMHMEGAALLYATIYNVSVDVKYRVNFIVIFANRWT